MKESKRVEFKPPKDFIPPEASEQGEWDLVCTFRTKGDGTVCLVQLGDFKMPGYEEKGEKKPETKPNYQQYAQGMQAAMANTGGGAAPGAGGGAGAS